MWTEGEVDWSTAPRPPTIVIGFPSSPATKLSKRSVYVPFASTILSPGTAFESASGRLYTASLLMELRPATEEESDDAESSSDDDDSTSDITL